MVNLVKDSNLILGFDEPTYMCSMANDYNWHQNSEKIERKTADRMVHIPVSFISSRKSSMVV